jgi:hypothetical protein
MMSGKEKNRHRTKTASLDSARGPVPRQRQICAVMRRNAMPGRISSHLRLLAHFFDRGKPLKGYRQRAILAEPDGRSSASDWYRRGRFFQRRPTGVGYIGSVRLDPPYRGKTIVYQGVEVVKQWHEETFGVPFYPCAFS